MATKNRFHHALAIQAGAVNITAIALSLVDAAREARETGDPKDDPAVRLMIHQLAFLCGTREIDDEPEVYRKLVAECERGAAPPTRCTDLSDHNGDIPAERRCSVSAAAH